jgi:hypothetical protein
VIHIPQLPDFPAKIALPGRSKGEAALDELDGTLQSDVLPGGKEEMDVVGHQDELVKLESPLLSIILKGGEK